jgi:uncharacterized membrane protein YeaQ/YmgE (transglycosylase-associated protein family)
VHKVAGAADSVTDAGYARHGSSQNRGVFMLETNSLIVILIVGLIAGWLAGKIMKGSGFGIIGDLVVGIIGAFIGGWLWGFAHLPSLGPWWLTAIVSATVGALILLFVIGLVKRR